VAVSVKPRTHEGQPDIGTGTLGDLLYADSTKTRLSETEWVRVVESIAAGDQLALQAMYERLHRVVFTLVMRITSNRETAEELTLDVFHEVWRRAGRYDAAGGPVVGWVMNQARSRAIDRLRFEQRKKRANPHPDQPFTIISASDSGDIFAIGDQGRILRQALAVLSPDERVAIETAFFSELTHSEVASRLKQPLGTVKTRIRSGLEKLRQELGTGVKDL
jgi:RNA polymerase sigma-70 factor, ECF subfamily